ncbi:MAG: hypothetical protein K5644_03370 [Lachnospiraceae bacterium]|nr:hypothetical protein [Lachnospiraceae bacterium]
MEIIKNVIPSTEFNITIVELDVDKGEAPLKEISDANADDDAVIYMTHGSVEDQNKIVLPLYGVATDNNFINIDKKDVRRMFDTSGYCYMAIGVGTKEKDYSDGIEKATDDPLVKTYLQKGKDVIVSLTIPGDASLLMMDDAIGCVTEYASEDSEIFVQVNNDATLKDEAIIAIIVIGIEE